MTIIPDRLGTQMGYRKWEVRFKPNATVPLRLYPMSPLATKHPWNSRTNVAECSLYSHRQHTSDDDEVPVWDCSCGYHCFYNYDTIKPLVTTLYGINLTGIALTWGNIVHHETFFRAQYAAPMALYLPRSKYSELVLLKNYIPKHIRQIDNEDDLVCYGEEMREWTTLPSHLDPTRDQSDGKW